MKFVTYELAEQINYQLIKDFSEGEMVGVKDSNLLHSAVNRPKQTMFSKALYAGVVEKAVALYESLAKNHCFYNGNKRSAFVCMTYFLYINNHVCIMGEPVAADLTVNFVVGDVSFEEVVQTVKAHSYCR